MEHCPQRHWVTSERATIFGQSFFPVSAMFEQTPLALTLAISNEVLEPSALNNVTATSHIIDVKVTPQLKAVSFLAFTAAQHVVIVGDST